MRRLLVHAHFDAEGRVRPCVAHALRGLAQCCDEIHFVSNGRIDAASRGALALCSRVIERENEGLDFGAWRAGLRETDLSSWDELVLTNDSVYGPVFPLKESFERMQGQACDFWGMTESFEIDRHLQSYFLVFRRRVLGSSVFRAFWEEILDYRNKAQFVRSYEVGLSQWLLQHGFRMGAVVPWVRLVAFSRFYGEKERRFVHPLNPALGFGEELLRLRMPFLKREVLRDNPTRVDVAKLRELMGQLGYPCELLLEEAPRPLAMPLEGVPRCPLCGSDGAVLYRDLRDRLRVVAPHCWNLRRCGSRSCRVLWLDPRPTPAGIGAAYHGYYTHAAAAPAPEVSLPRHSRRERRLLRMLNRALKRMRVREHQRDHYLHGLGRRQPGRLLEVGCGGGVRLADLRKLGWQVEGQEVDPEAAAICSATHGIPVHQGLLEALRLPSDTYDTVLLSHVLEHVHAPAVLLAEIHRVLRPGGEIVLATPNVDAFGHWLYRKHWIHLDPPRHLCVYSVPALRRLLEGAGFARVEVSTSPLNMEGSAIQSRDIERSGWTEGVVAPRIGRELGPVGVQLLASLLHRIRPGSGEECVGIARKSLPAGAT